MSFENIAGYESEKDSLREICFLLHRYDELADMGIRLPHGVLLSGRPGVGKTVMAEALIAEANIPCVRVSAGAAEEGELTAYLEARFAEAMKSTPSIVFLDELDKMVGEAENFRYSYNMTNSRKVLQVINDHKDDGILVVATVNNMQMLCDAFKRSGRFDRILDIPLPTFDDRLKIVDFYCTGKPISKRIDQGYVAKMTAGMSGADIECLVNEAGIHAVLDGSKTVRQKDFDFAVGQKVFHGTSRENKMTEDQNLVLATHEAGHLVAGLINDPDSVTGVSILPQGESAGHCGLAPYDDDIPTLRALEGRIVGLLAGKAAEKIFFPEEEFLSSSSDFELAAHYVKRLITEEGAFGVEYIVDNASRYDSVGISQSKISRIEKKRDDVLTNALEKATAVLTEHRELVSTFARQLVRRYSLNRTEILRIYAAYRRKSKKQETAETSVACA